MDDKLVLDAATIANIPNQRCSVSTVDSDTAEEIVRQYENTAKINNFPITYSQTQSNSVNPNVHNNITFDKSDGIHVGDIINYYYSSPIFKDRNDPQCEVHHKSQSITRSESTLISTTSQNHNKSTAHMSRRKILSIIAISILIIALITGGILFMMRHKLIGIDMIETTTIKNIETTSSTEVDSTTISAAISTTSVETTTTGIMEHTTPVITLESFVSRKQWNAELPRATVELKFPIYRIIIAQTGTEACTLEEKCTKLVQELQRNSTELDDIPYNFLIGSDSKVYEGRGFLYEGQHTVNRQATEYNSIGICVAFIGNYENDELDESQVKVFHEFIRYFMELDIIDRNYTIFLQDQLIRSVKPANGLEMSVQKWQGYRKLQKIYHRSEWNASVAIRPLEKFNRPMNWSLVTSTADIECFNFMTCATTVRKLQSKSLIDLLDDIPYAFLIGGEGLIFEGRGWDYIGQHTDIYDKITVAVCVIGSFGVKDPSQKMLDATKNILEDGAALGKLTNDFKINGRQELGDYKGPGGNFVNKMYAWPRWNFIIKQKKSKFIKKV